MKKQLQNSKKNTELLSVNLKEIVYRNLNLYGFVAHKSIGLGGSEFDIVASAYNTTIYLLTCSLHKTTTFALLKHTTNEQRAFFTRLVSRGVECGVAIQIDEGLIFYLPYRLVVASEIPNFEIITTQLDLLRTHLHKWRTLYENYNKEQYRY